MRKAGLVVIGAAWLMMTGIVAGDEGYDPKGKRDPFVSLVRDGKIVAVTEGSSSNTSAFQLHGIVWDSAGHSMALINETEVKVGDVIADYQVTDIRQNSVILVRDGEFLELQIAFDEPPASTPSREATGGEGP